MAAEHSKVFVLGHDGVGRVSLFSRLSTGDYAAKQSFLQTIGTEMVKLQVTVGPRTIQLELLTTSGQNRFRTMSPSYYRGARAILAVLDITDAASAESVRSWVQQIRANSPGVPILVAGNKLDLEASRVVPQQSMQDFCSGLGLHYLEVSAEDGTNVDKLLSALASLL